MKKILAVGLLLCVLFLAGCSLKKSSGNENFPNAEPTPVPTRPIEETITQRPFVSLTPTADGHWVNLEIKNILQGTTGLEYDLIYFAEVEGSKIERGISTGGKPAELNGAVEYAKKVLFGSASCTTGVCKYKYDENVTEGTFNLQLMGGKGSEKYATAYRIQRGKEAKEGLTTGDGTFSLVSSVLPANTFFLTISTIGVPVSLPTGIVPKSAPYGIFPAISAKGKVSFRTDLTQGNIYAYSGKSWQKLTTNFGAGQATAETSGNFLFILGQ